MAELQQGSQAPPVQLTNDAGETFNLADYRGKKQVVLYFYPKADTPGCTTEACEFRDSGAKFTEGDVVVAGVSPDEPKALAKFKQKYGLDFPLLADPDHQVAEAYGVWKEKSMYGKKYMGVDRTTFLIDKEGKIAKVFEKVKPAGHASQVLESLATL